ncbi:MAG: HlyC/CorC family transporter [Kiritimatiellae bacterium]|nr:HlyC/CorC family transporter [Kiritimatiellia bacterium]
MILSVLSAIGFLLALAASAYCSSAETAFFATKGDPVPPDGASSALRRLLRSPTALLSTVLIANNIVNIFLSNLGYAFFDGLFPRRGALLSIPAVTVILVFFGELGPKYLGLRHRERLMAAYAPSLLSLTRLLRPARLLLDAATRRFSAAFRPKGKTLSEEEFETVLDISGEEGVINAEELAQLKAIVNLEDLHASDVMTPRVEIIGIDLDDGDVDRVEVARTARRHYVALYRGSADFTEGFLDVRKFLLDPAHDLAKASFPAVHVPEGLSLNRLLVRFQREKLRIALVVDEYGGVAGVVTRGDVLEEITGEIFSDLSGPRAVFQQTGPRTWLMDANVSLEELNRKLDLALEAESSDRLAGWIAERLGRVPRAGDVCDSREDGIRVRVAETARLRVKLATVELVGRAAAGGEERRG